MCYAEGGGFFDACHCTPGISGAHGKLADAHGPSDVGVVATARQAQSRPGMGQPGGALRLGAIGGTGQCGVGRPDRPRGAGARRCPPLVGVTRVYDNRRLFRGACAVHAGGSDGHLRCGVHVADADGPRVGRGDRAGLVDYLHSGKKRPPLVVAPAPVGAGFAPDGGLRGVDPLRHARPTAGSSAVGRYGAGGGAVWLRAVRGGGTCLLSDLSATPRGGHHVGAHRLRAAGRGVGGVSAWNELARLVVAVAPAYDDGLLFHRLQRAGPIPPGRLGQRPLRFTGYPSDHRRSAPRLLDRAGGDGRHAAATRAW